MTKLLTQIQRIKRKVDVYLFLYEDNGEVIPMSTQIGYYGYYTIILAVTGGLMAVAL